MHVLWMILLIIMFFLSGCSLIDKLDDMDEEPEKIYDPGTEPASQAFTRNPTADIQVSSVEGVGVNIPPNSLVTEAGTLPTTYVSIVLTNHLTEYSQPWNMPGGFLGQNVAGTSMALVTFGTVEITAQTADNDLLNLQTGANAKLEIPALPDSPENTSLWHLDEDQSFWIESGTALLNDTKYVGDVNHFSKWSVAVPTTSVCVEGTVFDGSGSPVVNTIVTAKMVSGTGLNGGQVFTDQQGHFLIDGLAIDSSFEIVAYGKNCYDYQLINLALTSSACVTLEPMTLSNGGMAADSPQEIDFAGSCDNNAASGVCINYTGTEYTADSVSSICGVSSPPATYFDTPCSQFNAIGMCTKNDGMTDETQEIYDADSFTSETAQTACTADGGIFSAL